MRFALCKERLSISCFIWISWSLTAEEGRTDPRPGGTQAAAHGGQVPALHDGRPCVAGVRGCARCALPVPLALPPGSAAGAGRGQQQAVPWAVGMPSAAVGVQQEEPSCLARVVASPLTV
jgi:hypothetical protein